MYDLAVQWRALAKRQEARQAGVEEAMDHPEATAADREMLDGLKEAFHNARTPEVCRGASPELPQCLNPSDVFAHGQPYSKGSNGVMKLLHMAHTLEVHL